MMIKNSLLRKVAGEIKFILLNCNIRAACNWFIASILNHQAPLLIRVGKQEIWVRPNTTDLLVTRCCFEFGEFDSLAKLSFKSHVKYIVDGGAYIGASSIRLAALFRDATILAVEPNSQNFEILTRNVEHIPRIIPIHAALADDDGFVEIYNNFGRHWGITTLQLSTNAVSERVTSYSLDSLIAKYFKEGYVDILKLDVEGAELSIFHGAKRWIQNVGSLIVETHDFLRPGCTRAFFECTEDFVDVYIDGEKFLCYNNAYVAETTG